MHTLRVISGRLAVKYNSDPIMHLYLEISTFLPFSSLSNLVVGLIGTLQIFASDMSKRLSSSLTYFDWEIKVPPGDCSICNPKKNLSSPIKLISNSFCIRVEKSLHIDAFVEPKIISSTYICTSSM